MIKQYFQTLGYDNGLAIIAILGVFVAVVIPLPFA